jgi:hypothetical protein
MNIFFFGCVLASKVFRDAPHLALIVVRLCPDGSTPSTQPFFSSRMIWLLEGKFMGIDLMEIGARLEKEFPKMEFIRLSNNNDKTYWHLTNETSTKLACKPNFWPESLAKITKAILYTNRLPENLCPTCRRLLTKKGG